MQKSFPKWKLTMLYLSNICNSNDSSIIVSIDKDFKQVCGWHYNFVKKDKFYVSPEEGLRFFYKQILTGDSIDGIMVLMGLVILRLIRRSKT